jgi:hypothetical protein
MRRQVLHWLKSPDVEPVLAEALLDDRAQFGLWPGCPDGLSDISFPIHVQIGFARGLLENDAWALISLSAPSLAARVKELTHAREEA